MIHARLLDTVVNWAINPAFLADNAAIDVDTLNGNI
jgi:hypothetical protein